MRRADPARMGASYWCYTVNELGMEDVAAQIDHVHVVKCSELRGGAAGLVAGPLAGGFRRQAAGGRRAQPRRRLQLLAPLVWVRGCCSLGVFVVQRVGWLICRLQDDVPHPLLCARSHCPVPRRCAGPYELHGWVTGLVLGSR